MLRMVPVALVVLALVSSSKASAEQQYALMGAHGEAFPQVLAEVDKQARRALTAASLDVMAPEALNAQLEELSKSNALEGCTVGDDDCAVRIGLALGVDVVITESVSVMGSHMLLKVSALKTSGAPGKHVYGELTLPGRDDGASVKSAVLRAVGKPMPPTPVPVAVTVDPPSALLLVKGSALNLEDGRVWLPPGSYTVEIKVPNRPAQEEHLDVTDDALATVSWKLAAVDAGPSPSSPDGGGFVSPGIIVAGIGAGTAAVGAIIALSAEAYLGTPMPPAERQLQNAQNVGMAGIVVAGVGVVAAAGGGAWLLLE